MDVAQLSVQPGRTRAGRFTSHNAFSPASPGAAEKHEPFTVVRLRAASRHAHHSNKSPTISMTALMPPGKNEDYVFVRATGELACRVKPHDRERLVLLSSAR
jgi:hypothetical protein